MLRHTTDGEINYDAYYKGNVQKSDLGLGLIDGQHGRFPNIGEINNVHKLRDSMHGISSLEDSIENFA